MKILFLDLDGVVNTARTPVDEQGFALDPYMAFLVGRIVEATGCKVVLSSAWRYGGQRTLDYVAQRIVPLHDITPMSNGLTSRGLEIKEWLLNHNDVDKYAILDDAEDMLDEQLPNFFKTSFYEGLTDEIANRVIEHLT